jgi:hypothetical protein
MAIEVITAGNHMDEPPWTLDRVSAHCRDRAPERMRGEDAG